MHGIANREEGGRLVLSRTGPFAPPISVTAARYTIVVTEPFREKLQSSGLAFPSFQRVVTRHIAEFHWEQWDRGKELPVDKLPRMKEIEDLVYGLPHSDAIAQQMRPLWEFQVEPEAMGSTETINERDLWHFDVCLHANGRVITSDFIGGSIGDIIVTERAKEWLEQNVGEWLMFHDVIVRDMSGA